MSSTAINALPYPSLTAPTPPDVPADFQALAEAVDTKVIAAFASATARDAAITSPTDGMACYLADVDRYYGRINGAWEWVAAPVGTVLSGTTGSRPATPTSTVLYWNTTTASLEVYSGGWAEVVPGAPLEGYKTSATSRTSSTYTIDPDLKVTLPTTGTYRFRLYARISTTAQIDYGLIGTATASTVVASATVYTAATAPRVDSVASLSVAAASTVPAVNTPLLIEGVVVCSGIGTFGLGWDSQNNASTVTVAGGYLTVAKVA